LFSLISLVQVEGHLTAFEEDCDVVRRLGEKSFKYLARLLMVAQCPTTARQQQPKVSVVRLFLPQHGQVFERLLRVIANENRDEAPSGPVAGGVQIKCLVVVPQGDFVTSATHRHVAAPDQPLGLVEGGRVLF
jgi:hypothetical protein